MQPQVKRCTSDGSLPLVARPDITRLASLAPAPRPWQWTEIWDRSSPTRRSPPECQPLPLINAWSFLFTLFFLVDALYPLLRALFTTATTVATSIFLRHCDNWTSTALANLLPSNGYAVYDRYCLLPPRSGLKTSGGLTGSGYRTT